MTTYKKSSSCGRQGLSQFIWSYFCPLLVAGLLIILISGIAGPAFAAEKTYSSGYFYYTLEDESVSITGYFGKEKKVEVPSSIAGYPVSKICKGAFTDSRKVRKIHLPDTIMTIEEGSFAPDQKVTHDWGSDGGGNSEVADSGEDNDSGNIGRSDDSSDVGDRDSTRSTTGNNNDTVKETKSNVMNQNGGRSSSASAGDDSKDSAVDPEKEIGEMNRHDEIEDKLDESESGNGSSSVSSGSHVGWIIGVLCLIAAAGGAFLYYRKRRGNQ